LAHLVYRNDIMDISIYRSIPNVAGGAAHTPHWPQHQQQQQQHQVVLPRSRQFDDYVTFWYCASQHYNGVIIMFHPQHCQPSADILCGRPPSYAHTKLRPYLFLISTKSPLSHRLHRASRVHARFASFFGTFFDVR